MRSTPGMPSTSRSGSASATPGAFASGSRQAAGEDAESANHSNRTMRRGRVSCFGSGICTRFWSSLRDAARGARTRVVVSAALLGVALLAASACSSEDSAAGSKFVPAKRDALTVATALLSSPGFWQRDPPTSGFEGGLAAALARHLHLDHVEVVQVPFAKIVHGELGGADIALSQL